MVEEMLAARGVDVSHENVRSWAEKFGREYSNRIRRQAPARQKALGRGCEAPVVAMEPVASAMQIIATAAAMPAKAGTKVYYLQRLQRDFPALAEKIASGEISVYAASIAAGLHKAPAKASEWTKADTYMPKVDA